MASECSYCEIEAGPRNAQTVPQTRASYRTTSSTVVSLPACLFLIAQPRPGLACCWAGPTGAGSKAQNNANCSCRMRAPRLLPVARRRLILKFVSPEFVSQTNFLVDARWQAWLFPGQARLCNRRSAAPLTHTHKQQLHGVEAKANIAT